MKTFNLDKLHPMAKLWPFVAIAARYDTDSGDNDGNPFDYIEDTISGENGWFPGAVIHRFFDAKHLDFTYAVEINGELIIPFLGTEGGITGPGWNDDLNNHGFGTEKFIKLRGHVGFIEAGELAAKQFIHLVNSYSHNFSVAMHSRGARGISSVRYWWQQLGVIPRAVYPFCGPPVLNRDGATAYDACGLGGVTFRPVMHHDIVDNAGEPFLQHVGKEIKLPHVEPTALRNPIANFFVGGHAYSTVRKALIKYFDERDAHYDVEWLEATKKVDEI